MINVVIADDHQLVREGIRTVLERSGEIHVLGEAQDGQEAIELVERLKPDILIIDISMPRLNGIQAIERIKDSSTKVIILSMYSDRTLVSQALHNGAKGYLLKRALTSELLQAIRVIHEGEMYFSPTIASHLYDSFMQSSQVDSGYALLSSREREVMRLVAEGQTNNEIAQALVLSVKTVEKHRANIMEKLGVQDLAGLIRVALKYGLIFLDE